MSKSPQSPRLKGIVVLLYCLGLSYRGVSTALAAFSLPLSYVSGWRDVQELGELIQGRPKGHARVVGIDETYVKLKGKATAVGLVVDMGNGHTLMVQVLDTENASRYLKWLSSCAEELGMEVLVSDDSSDYRVPVEELAVPQQLCLVHIQRTVARNVRKLLREEKEVYKGIIERLRELVKEPKPKDVAELWHMLQAPLPGRLRSLVIYLLNSWHKMVLYLSSLSIPATNNRTEQAILRSKLRYRTTRGLKSVRGIRNFFAVTQEVYSQPWQAKATS